MNRRAVLRSTTGSFAAFALGKLAFAQSAADSHRLSVEPAASFSRSFPRIIAGRTTFSAEDIVAVAQADLYGESQRASQVEALWKQIRAGGALGTGEAHLRQSTTLSNPEGVRHLAELLRSGDRRQAQAPAAALLRSQDARFVGSVLGPIVVTLVACGLEPAKAAQLVNAELGGVVTVQMGAGYAAGMIADVTVSRSDNMFAIRLDAAVGQAPGQGSEPVPGPSTQGFFDWLRGAVAGLMNFYLDMLWNMFMGAAAGAGLGASIGGPVGGLWGGYIGAGAGAWYTMGKTLAGLIGGGVWLGPDPSNPDLLCGNPLVRC